MLAFVCKLAGITTKYYSLVQMYGDPYLRFRCFGPLIDLMSRLRDSFQKVVGTVELWMEEVAVLVWRSMGLLSV